ncbi:hypothetical protein [Candidatus Methylacidithermus pantelleriae]|uniref:Uncharacterized protein n=1 Tax=Candidatus Methylacidithermus pantelleriae TaxID=2744239 RepID=A0A8J2BVF3_9BACT|nr:hypothetical protein [Candidatus Methylacidithermus pantelleriae]CAF0703827.1 hypothetical protein MPNT_60113 [Candidatus Methylacidithermus pantelleriae]
MREKNRRLAILGPKLHALLAEEESRAGAFLFGFGPPLGRKSFHLPLAKMERLDNPERIRGIQWNPHGKSGEEQARAIFGDARKEISGGCDESGKVFAIERWDLRKSKARA